MTESTAISRVLTLVFTDLADSTALKSQHGDSAMDTLLTRHADHVTRLAAECSGRIIDWAGDGCFLTFEISSAGVVFALRLQQVHAEELDLPGVRVGIHLGEVTEKPGTGGGPPRVGGLAVDLASRICGLAKPGQVLMSAAVYNSARQRLGVDAFGQPVLWQTHGTYALKGFDEPMDIGEAALEGATPHDAPTSGDKAKLIRRAKHPAPHTKPARSALKSARRFVPLALGAALVLALVGVAAYFAGQSKTGTATPAPAPAPVPDVGPIKSLAVLPLDNLSTDPEQEYFADGMTEAITSELSKIKALKVISRTSVTKYKKSDKTMPEIAAELKVEGLIEGSVQRDGDDVRITVQLIHGPSDAHLWTNSYTNTMTSVLKLQSDVALAIADAMKAELTGEERTRIAKSRTVDPKAYDAYLLGMHFRQQVTPEGIRTAIRYFEEATRLDPRFAEAWAMEGSSYSILTGFGMASPAETLPKARELYLKALEIDGDLPNAHIGLGSIAFRYDWEWEQAEQRFRRALELDPRFARGHVSYGFYLAQMGRRSEAVEQAETALELDPDDPWAQHGAGSTLADAGQPDRARAVLERLLESHPDFLPVFGNLGWTYLDLGNHEKALAFLDQGVEASGQHTDELLWAAVGLAAAGQPDRARASLTEALGKGGYFDAGVATLAYAALGELDSAFDWMDKSIAARDQGLGRFRVLLYRKALLNNPNVVKFRTDPRFWKLMDRAKLPPLPPDHPGYAEEQAWLAKKKAAADATAPINKIAVLPFKNISGDPQQEFFVDGMTEALISELAKIKSIKVISRTSAMHYKDTTQTLPEIARELGVDGLVEGSAMKAGNEVRITAQLIRAATDDNLWAESYTEPLENVLKMQAQVALTIAGEIKAVVTPEERSRVNAAKTVNIEAYELYMQGRHFWNLRSLEGLRRARELFTKSLEIDPNFALGHVGLADTYYILSDYYLMPSAETLRLGGEEAGKALALDPALGEAYATLAFIGMAQNWDWKAAKETFLKAIELSPNYATGHFWYGVYLSAEGRQSQAAEELRQASQLDPASPVIAAAYAEFLARDGQIQESVNLAKRVGVQYPDNPRVQMGLARIYGIVGQYDDELAAAERLIAAEGSKVNAAMYKAVALAHLGRLDEARDLIEDTLLGADVLTMPSVMVARAYAALNDRDHAFEWLTKACDTHDPYVWRIKRYLEFDALESDPRYQALLRRMNFPEAGAQN
jgi:TolB-like protein/class 3 adenylate cyclase/Tfp pilus assembly protein PilF